ncbi:MAG: hypothetical protein ABR538_13690 [Candidatus Binatia bacterium]
MTNPRSFILTIAAILTLAIVSLPGTPSQAAESKCAAAKVKAGAKKASAAAKCYSKALQSDVAVDLECLGKAESKFEAAFAKADATDANCPHIDDSASVEAIVDEFVTELVAQVTAAPSCTDGITNGSETDLDCGGACGGCAIGDSCVLAEDCLSSNCEGNVCELLVMPLSCSSDGASSIPATAPSSLSGYTCGSPTANLPQNGPEDIYAFQCQVSGSVIISFSNIGCDLDFYVIEETATPNTCLAGSTGPNGLSDSLGFSCTAGTDYFVVVENPSETTCDYAFDVQTGAAGGCREDCDDGLDNDGDGDIDAMDADCVP